MELIQMTCSIGFAVFIVLAGLSLVLTVLSDSHALKACLMSLLAAFFLWSLYMIM